MKQKGSSDVKGSLWNHLDKKGYSMASCITNKCDIGLIFTNLRVFLICIVNFVSSNLISIFLSSSLSHFVLSSWLDMIFPLASSCLISCSFCSLMSTSLCHIVFVSHLLLSSLLSLSHLISLSFLLCSRSLFWSHVLSPSNLCSHFV